MYKSSFFRWHCNFLSNLLCHLTHQTHLIQRKLISPRGALHDRREKRLGVEEAGEPDGVGRVEVRSPGLQLLDPEKQVRVPGAQTVQRGIGELCPRWGDLVKEQTIGQILHVCCYRQLSFQS